MFVAALSCRRHPLSALASHPTPHTPPSSPAPQDDEELSFAKGARIKLLEKVEEHWWEGELLGVPRHVIAVGHEEGWAEVWQLLGRWIGWDADHANHRKGWDDLHPASPTRQIVSLQLSGRRGPV